MKFLEFMTKNLYLSWKCVLDNIPRCVTEVIQGQLSYQDIKHKNNKGSFHSKIYKRSSTRLVIVSRYVIEVPKGQLLLQDM